MTHHNSLETSAADGCLVDSASILAVVAGELRTHLQRLLDFVNHLSPAAYSTPVRTGLSPQGAHVRHILDRITSVLNADDIIKYDERRRGTDVELLVEAGRQALRDCIDRLEHFRPTRSTVLVEQTVAASGGFVTVRFESSIVRELSEVLSHTVHHMALVRMMADDAGHQLPEEFGLATSTRAFRQVQG